MIKVISKDTRTKPINATAVSSSVSQTQKQPPDVLYEKTTLKDFAIFTGKHLCWSLFLIKFGGGIQASIFIRKCFQRGVFPCEYSIAKFLRTSILKHIYQLLLLQTAKIFIELQKTKLKRSLNKKENLLLTLNRFYVSQCSDCLL